MPDSTSSLNRRQILSGLMKLLILIGLIFVSVPFISSVMTSPTDKKEKDSPSWVITIPLLELVQGEVKSLSWSGGVVWVYPRTENDLIFLEQHKVLLRDAFSAFSEQPEQMKNQYRSANERYFVFIPQENKRGCQVHLNDEREQVVFIEPCYRAQYDAAGRIFENTGHAEQQNLIVPEHVVEDGFLKIGAWTPSIKINP